MALLCTLVTRYSHCNFGQAQQGSGIRSGCVRACLAISLGLPQDGEVLVSVGLLQGFKLELAYALVGKSSLDWLPQVDELLTLYCEERLRSVDHGEAIWSNRGPRHHLRVGSRAGLEDLGAARELLAGERDSLQTLAAQLDARLMPCGMHPWMLPAVAETWPHGPAPEDAAMGSLFGADRHGLANQHPLRLSIPFASELEFESLFAALRFVMPLMPALAASSPFAEGKRGPAESCRVAARRDLFSVELDFADSLVPKSSTCAAEYRSEVLAPLSKALSSRGLDKTLDPLQVCANGVLADFEEGFVHVEMLDMQECLQADIAVCAATAALTQLVQSEPFESLKKVGQWPRARLEELLEQTLVSGGQAVFRDRGFAEVLGFPESGPCQAAELWQFLIEEKICEGSLTADSMPALRKMAAEGSLSARLRKTLPGRWKDEDLYNLYRQVLDCHDKDELL